MALPFIHPWMLAGTAMGSAPVIIHLLNRQRYKRITWAAMHWLLASFKKSSRRLQIEDLILLIIRILILVLLALALARPFLHESGSILGGKSHVHRVIILDTSFSMAYNPGGKDVFSQAKETARYLTTTSTLSSGDAVTVISMTDRASARIKASTNLSEVYREVDSAEVSHGASDPVKALTLAVNMLDESDHPSKEVFLITDMTRNGWIDPEGRTERVRGLEDLQKAVKKYKQAHPDRELPTVFLLDMGSEKAQNMAVTNLEADVNVIAAKSQVVFKAEISNFTDKDLPQLSVTFQVNGERVGDQQVDVKAGGGHNTAMFFHQFEVPGPHWVTVSIASDRLSLDDTRHMAVPVVPDLKVLAVDGEEKPDPLESETGLLTRVLTIPISERMATRGIVSPSIISCQVIPDSGLTDAQFEGVDLLILANVPVIPADKLPQIRKFVREGGGLLIFVGENVGPELYNEKLFTDDDPLLPCRLLEPQGEGGNPDAKKFWTLKPDDSTGTVFPTFARKERWPYLEDPDKGVRVFKRYRVKIDEPRKEKARAAAKPEKEEPEKTEKEAGENGEAEKKKKPEKPARGRVSVPLRYHDDGEPAILIREYGMGKVCLVTTTADKCWNDMPAKVAHLPLMYDLALNLVRERGKKHNLPVGGTFSIKWPAEDLLKDVVAMPPEGHEEDKRTIRPDARKDITTLTYYGRNPEEGVRWAGAYRLNLAGDDELRDIFVVNVDPAESDLERMPVDKLKTLVKGIKFEKIAEREKIVETIKAKASGKEFWRNLTWAVLTLAVLETFLAWFFGRRRW